ncbi:MAG TPA: DUF6508 domain-containing protein [Fimbriimonadaceae bacterium]|nr:DUF6508 domain-containing protein [Fimbriimonadaceae bacterium]
MNEPWLRVLELLPILESPDFVAATWPKLAPRIENGVKIIQMPYPEYHPAIDELRSAVWGPPDLDPYKALPEDPPDIQLTPGLSFPIEYFETATANQVRRYLMLCFRGERFCDGHIDGEFLNGKIVAALRRLRSLQSQ